MAKFRAKKQELEELLKPPNWPGNAESIPETVLKAVTAGAVNALIALLPRGGLITWRAAVLVGLAVSRIAQKNIEDARIIMRRLMWHLNEDSGNMGWGISEAFGEILARSPGLASEYGHIALSYVRDTGFADNYIDHGILRRGAYWAIGRFGPLYPEFRAEGMELLAKGMADAEPGCRGAAAWAIGAFAARGLVSDEEKAALTRPLEKEMENTQECQILDGLRLYSEPAAFFARQTLNRFALSPSG